MKKFKLIIAVSLILFSIFGLFFSALLPSLESQDQLFSTKPSFYPLFLFSGLLFFALNMCIRTFFLQNENIIIFNKDCCFLLIFFTGYSVILPLVGFIPATAVFAVGSGYYLTVVKERKTIVTLVLIDTVLVVALYILFVQILNVPL